MRRKSITFLVLLLISVAVTPSSFAAAPVSISNVTVQKKWNALIALKITAKNNTSREVQLSGELFAVTKDGQTIEIPDFDTLIFYDAYSNPCAGNSINGTWKPRQSASSVFCFALPKGKTIKKVFIASSKYSTPLVSVNVNIKN